MKTLILIYLAICLTIFLINIVIGVKEDLYYIKNNSVAHKFGFNVLRGGWKHAFRMDSFFWIFTLCTSLPILNLVALGTLAYLIMIKGSK